LGHPSKFQRVSRLRSVTAGHSSSGRQLKSACSVEHRAAPTIYIRKGSHHVGHWPTF